MDKIFKSFKENQNLSYQGHNKGSGKANSTNILLNDMFSKINKLADNNKANTAAIKVIKTVANKPDVNVIIYRATHGKTINSNDWVFLTNDEAKRYTFSRMGTPKPGYVVLKKTVKAKEIEWTGKNLEFIYMPKK